MRPLKLVMTGFESYKEKTEINFEELGTKGLYLITGVTGAGKTTIFDAITFALYGSPSGTDRSVEMLRSHFADENTPTEVELDFEANGKQYKIKRNPEYERKALRGEGTTKEAANALLEFTGPGSGQNREPITGVSKVTAEIENILNLKKEQFCRIAMIAQGRFQELLLSKKDAKQEILRELFHTEKYEKLQETLKNDKSEADKGLKELKLRLETALTKIEVNQKDEQAEKINQIKASAYVTQDGIQILRDFALKDEQLLSDVLNEITEVESALEKINSELQIGEGRKKLEEQLTNSQKMQAVKQAENAECDAELKEAQKAAENVPELEKEKTLLEASLKDYEEIARKEDELKNLERAIGADEKSLSILQEKKDEAAKKYESLRSEQSELKNAGEKIGTLEAAAEKISEEQNDLSEIERQLFSLSKEKTALKAAQEKVKDSALKAKNAGETYNEMLHLFNLEQAGILAESLKDGCACPVCGSTEHPNPAKKSQEAPTQQKLKEAKTTADDLQKDASELSVEAAKMKTSVEKSEEAVNALIKKYFKESLSGCEDQKLSIMIQERNAELKLEAQKTKENLTAEKTAKARRDQIEEQILQAEEGLKKYESDISKLVAKNSAEKAKFDAESKNLAEKKSGLKYQTLVQAKENYMQLENTINALKQRVEKAKENQSKIQTEIARLKGEVESLKTQLKDIRIVDMEKLTNDKALFAGKKAELNAERDFLNERKGVNQDSIRTVEELVPQINKATERYNMISALAEVAGGSSRGKNGKPSLETYVQMHCLDQINYRANQRLRTMTDNKYELRRRVEEDGSELGLDLNVKDFYTGRERNVQTLSGGEQFQASLSLALGLADEIQSNSGGIKLDTMFIDEGFGTLDAETLNKAMRALENLSQGNKLIGIISHVEELESRIPQKIVVKKDEIGISHAQIVHE